MRLYLVRHSEAKSETEDPARPLSAHGLREAGAVAGHLAKLMLSVGRICHSGKLRAEQTAGVIAASLEGAYRARPLVLEKTDGLVPADDPSVWAKRLAGIEEDIMLVGHLPHLGRLASLLLCGDPTRDLIAFPSAGTVCLERDKNGGWTVAWMITPAALATCIAEEDMGSAVYEGDAGI